MNREENGKPNTDANTTLDMGPGEGSNLARQALWIYDGQGERAMAAFLIEQEAPGKNGHPDEWSYHLADGSVVEVTLGPGGAYRMITEPGLPERPATLDNLPPFFDRAQPMLDWPNAGSVLNDVSQTVTAETLPERRRPDDMDDMDEIHLNMYELLSAAPDLPAAIARAMGEKASSKLPNQTTDFLALLQRECAERAVEFLPEEQRARLRETVQGKIEAFKEAAGQE